MSTTIGTDVSDRREQLAQSDLDRAETDKLMAEINKLAAEQLKAVLEQEKLFAVSNRGMWDWRTLFILVYPPVAGALAAAVLGHCLQ